jgi:hypothetical protein
MGRGGSAEVDGAGTRRDRNESSWEDVKWGESVSCVAYRQRQRPTTTAATHKILRREGLRVVAPSKRRNLEPTREGEYARLVEHGDVPAHLLPSPDLVHDLLWQSLSDGYVHGQRDVNLAGEQLGQFDGVIVDGGEEGEGEAQAERVLGLEGCEFGEERTQVSRWSGDEAGERVSEQSRVVQWLVCDCSHLQRSRSHRSNTSERNNSTRLSQSHLHPVSPLTTMAHDSPYTVIQQLYAALSPADHTHLEHKVTDYFQSHLSTPAALATLPSLSSYSTTSTLPPPGTLVRFRAMVQDTGVGNEVYKAVGREGQLLMYGRDEDDVEEHDEMTRDYSGLRERQSFFVVSVPGETDWYKEVSTISGLCGCWGADCGRVCSV